MLKQLLSTKKIWLIVSIVAIAAVVTVIILLIINLSNAYQNQINNQAAITATPAPAIKVSESGKYQLRFSENSGLNLVTPDRTIPLLNDTVIDDSTTFDQNNVGWNADESVVVITYVNILEQNAYIAFYKTDGELIDKTALVEGYYGINLDQAFPPVVSGDGKYIAVQTELIHKISIFDFSGKLVKTLNTKYADVELFSDAMYELEGGTYNPFFEYKWNDDNSGVLYRFQNTDTFFEVKL
jgi:hypothetical protein